MSTCCKWIVRIQRTDGSVEHKQYLEEVNALNYAEHYSKEKNVEKVEVYKRWCS